MKLSMGGREVAKFFAGWAAGQAFGHWILGILGTDMFPVTIGRFTFSETWNHVAMVAWPVVLAVLAYIAWIGNNGSESASAPITHSI